MPFTPFHMGPGGVAKAMFGRHFSLTVFGFAQVAMDLEPLARMMRGEIHTHGLSHTYAGATVIGLASLVVGRLVCQRLFRLWPHTADRPFLEWIRGPGVIPWPAAALGAFGGTYSHVLLDGMMHAEMRPLWPLDGRGTFFNIVSMEGLHVLCALAGLVGLLALGVRYRLGHGPSA